MRPAIILWKLNLNIDGGIEAKKKAFPSREYTQDVL